jgi:hypothetical protein
LAVADSGFFLKKWTASQAFDKLTLSSYLFENHVSDKKTRMEVHFGN